MPAPTVWPFRPWRLAPTGRPPLAWPFRAWRRVPTFTPGVIPEAEVTATTLESAVREYLDTLPSLVAEFPGGITAGRRPPRSAAEPGVPTPRPYLRIETPTGMTVYTSSTSIVRSTKLILTVFAPGGQEVQRLSQLVYDAFANRGFRYVGTRVAPLVVANRTHGEEAGLAPPGASLFSARIEWTCREQTAR